MAGTSAMKTDKLDTFPAGAAVGVASALVGYLVLGILCNQLFNCLVGCRMKRTPPIKIRGTAPPGAIQSAMSDSRIAVAGRC